MPGIDLDFVFERPEGSISPEPIRLLMVVSSASYDDRCLVVFKQPKSHLYTIARHALSSFRDDR